LWWRWPIIQESLVTGKAASTHNAAKLPVQWQLILETTVTPRQVRRWMRSLVFEGNTWAAYEELREKDKKPHKALCKLLKEMVRSDPAIELGKPDQLRHNLARFWSKRISQKDRIIYKFDDQYINSIRRPAIMLQPEGIS
jgi:toxin YoeB